jgi:prepilin-type N-terminal cleavage/methylation domain-containing protein
MKKRIEDKRGFSLAEILIVLGIMGILATVVVLNFAGSDTGAKEESLKSNVAVLREALDLYKSDHGWYPCDPGDWNSAGKASNFVRQLTEFTDASGRPSKTKSTKYKYGPYLKKFPEEPVSGLSTVYVDTKTERIFSELAKAVSKGSGTGGWYYEALSGNVCGNLGKSFPTEYAGY